jgi:hypothetical protein
MKKKKHTYQHIRKYLGVWKLEKYDIKLKPFMLDKYLTSFDGHGGWIRLPIEVLQKIIATGTTEGLDTSDTKLTFEDMPF